MFGIWRQLNNKFHPTWFVRCWNNKIKKFKQFNLFVSNNIMAIHSRNIWILHPNHKMLAPNDIKHKLCNLAHAKITCDTVASLKLIAAIKIKKRLTSMPKARSIVILCKDRIVLKQSMATYFAMLFSFCFFQLMFGIWRQLNNKFHPTWFDRCLEQQNQEI